MRLCVRACVRVRACIFQKCRRLIDGVLQVDHCYNLKHGIRLHTERYDAVFSTAIKGTRKAA